VHPGNSWWNTHTIKDGVVYEWTDGVDGYRIYVDHERHSVFIFWHHS
jgi:hypothetical protein